MLNIAPAHVYCSMNPYHVNMCKYVWANEVDTTRVITRAGSVLYAPNCVYHFHINVYLYTITAILHASKHGTNINIRRADHHSQRQQLGHTMLLVSDRIGTDQHSHRKITKALYHYNFKPISIWSYANMTAWHSSTY